MARLIIVFLGFVLLGVAIALLFTQDNGYVLMRHGDTVVETSLAFFLFGLVLLVWGTIVVWRVLRFGIGLPNWLKDLLQKRKDAMARRSLNRGLVRLFEGQWAAAEAELTRRVWNPQTRLVNYLAAAKAAQMQGALQRRDDYLARADRSRFGSAEAVLLTQAELLIDQEQDARALATLERLRELAPQNPYVLGLLLETLARLKEWTKLRDLLPAAESLALLDNPRKQNLAVRAYSECLSIAAAQGLDRVVDAWGTVPRRLRANPKLVHAYAAALARHPQGHDDAVRAIQAVLKKQWDAQLVRLFGDLEARKPVTQLTALEDWLKQHGDQPELLLLAGRLCLRNKLWGRARSYFESALAQTTDNDQRAELYQELGKLNEQTEDSGGALNAYRQGLTAALGGTNEVSLSVESSKSS
ncbi:MAG: heme biosynthesis HemY N-terminal domain-containing protein [Nevskiales bacterium]